MPNLITLPKIDFGRLIAGLSTGELAQRDADLVRARGGKAALQHQTDLGWASFLERDLVVAAGKTGGYLVADEVGFAAEALRPASVAIASGPVVLPGLEGNKWLPRETASPSVYWLVGESDAPTESTPALGNIALSPKTGAAYVEFSRQLSIQGRGFDQFIRRSLLGAAGQAVDVAVINGTGTAGQPLGILNTAGIGAATGATLVYPDVLDALETVLTAGANEGALGWVTSPDVATLLRQRPRISAGDAILGDDNLIAGHPCRTSDNVPAGTLLLADWSRIVVGLWGPGVEVTVNPFAGFKSGIHGARVMVSVDVGVLFPSAVFKITGIS